MKKNFIISLAILVSGCWLATSCEDMMNVDSNRVVFSDDYDLDNASDTVYGTLGILNKFQKLADRYVLLGELRGDLLTINSNTETELQNLANFNFDESNEYLSVKDYYAVINNCNYFIAKADTALRRNNQKIMIKEYVAAKAIRAWTYLQLVTNYKEVPFFTEPILTVSEASVANYPKLDLNRIAVKMIADLLPYADQDQYPLPSWSGFLVGGNAMGGRLLFVPVRAILGDYYLWTGQYRRAADCYYNLIYDNVYADNNYRMNYSNEKGNGYYGRYSDIFSLSYNNLRELMTIVPMEYSTENGQVSALSDLFHPSVTGTQQLDGSPYWKNLSANQVYTYKNTVEANSAVYTVYGQYGGDLRINAITDNITYNGETYKGIISKFTTLATETSSTTTTDDAGNTTTTTSTTVITDEGGSILYYTPYVILYRSSLIYLRFAEALNRMAYEGNLGCATVAFNALKKGLKGNYRVVYEGDTIEYNFNLTAFDTNTGVHSRGCGQTEFNTVDYDMTLPVVATYYEKDTLDVTINDMLNFIEDKIVDELALEMTFEGNRFTDLVRFAQRRGNDYLAKRVASRGIDNTIYNVNSADFKYDNALYNKLMNEENWYLPLK